MTDTELITYFENAQLPDMLRVDRATKQHDLPEHAAYYIARLKERPDDKDIRFWLLRIKKALDEPFNGQEIPRF